jgi:hypothetical protein
MIKKCPFCECVSNIRKSSEFNSWLEDYMLNTYGKKRITNPQKIAETRSKFSNDKWEKIKSKHRETVKTFGRGKMF